jgi:DNA-binding NarL/FixJ family response regulator
LERIRLLIADDHEIIRVGLGVFLESAEDITLIGEARNGREALDLANQLSPDIILLDFELPDLNGILVASILKRRGSPVPILLMSSQETKIYVFAMLKTGASGFLSKQDLPEDFIRAIREVAAGQRDWLSPRMEEKMARWKRSPQNQVFSLPLSGDLADKQNRIKIYTKKSKKNETYGL